MDPSPKTLIVDLSNYYGGSTSRVLSLMKHMPVSEIALAGLESGAITQQARKLNLPVHIVGKSKTDPKILFNLIHLIRQQKYQILDSQNIQSKFWASIAARQTQTALISTIHSWYANEHGQKSIRGKIYTAIELSTNHSLKLYITVSERDRQSLLTSKISSERIELIYNAVEIDSNFLQPDREWLKIKLGLPKNSIVCLALGRLVPVKGYDILISAVKLVTTQLPNFVCVIIGEGEQKEILRNQINENRLENHIHLVGFYEREFAMAALRSCDIFTMPSRYEGTPIALLEAAAMGCPIIASASGGIPELVNTEEQALLVPKEDRDALANGLIRLSKDRQFATSLGLNARKHIQENFNLDQQIRQTRAAYQKAWRMHNAQTC